MKILILINSLSGLYHFRSELLEALSRNNEVVFDAPPDVFIDELESLGASYLRNDYLDRRGTNPLKDIRLFGHYLRLLRSFRPDAVLAYTIKPNVYGGIACSIRHVPFFANITGLGSSIQNGGMMQKFTLALYKLGLCHAKTVFFQNSENMRFFIDNSIVQGRAVLLPGSGVNTHFFDIEDYPTDEYGINLIYVGRIMREKGCNELLSAAESIISKHSNVRFTVLGPFEDDYEQTIADSVSRGIIDYIDRQPDVRPYVAEAHALINPSYHEGMSNVCLEAAAMGRPILASNIPGCRETFDEGISGISFNPKDTGSLIDAIERFIALPWLQRRDMGLAGREKVVREFDRNLVVDTYIEEIASLSKESVND